MKTEEIYRLALLRILNLLGDEIHDAQDIANDALCDGEDNEAMEVEEV